MKIEKFFWGISSGSIKGIKKTLKNPQNPKYVQRIFTILSRTDNTKEVFKITSKKDFIENWPKIRRYWSKRNQSPDFFAWWSAIYNQLVGKKKPIGEPSDTIKNISELIKNARINKGWTQSDLASRTSLGQDHISRIEKGKITNIETETLIRICKVLGIENIPVL